MERPSLTQIGANFIVRYPAGYTIAIKISKLLLWFKLNLCRMLKYHYSLRNYFFKSEAVWNGKMTCLDNKIVTT